MGLGNALLRGAVPCKAGDSAKSLASTTYMPVAFTLVERVQMSPGTAKRLLGANAPPLRTTALEYVTFPTFSLNSLLTIMYLKF